MHSKHNIYPKTCQSDTHSHALTTHTLTYLTKNERK